MKRVVVTGAFSYTGAAVARELMARGYGIHTLTNRKAAIAPQLAVGERPEDASSASFRRKPEPSLPNDSLSPLDTGFRWYDADIRASTPITSSSLAFDAAHLEGELAGADVFVNTFWIRLPHGGEDFTSAVDKSRLLIESAKRAGVRRIVHVSVSNAAVGSNLGYYAGKAQVEEIVRACGMSYAIVSPTLVVGPNDVLTNNIAWFLRRFPVFALPSGGSYRLQPVTLVDTARIIADAAELDGNCELDAAGPDIMTFAEYVRLVARACSVRRAFVSVPDWAALGALHFAGIFLRDVILTREELLGLKQELLVSKSPPLGKESVSDWLLAHGADFGRRYVNDLDRHFRGGKAKAI